MDDYTSWKRRWYQRELRDAHGNVFESSINDCTVNGYRGSPIFTLMSSYHGEFSSISLHSTEQAMMIRDVLQEWIDDQRFSVPQIPKLEQKGDGAAERREKDRTRGTHDNARD